MKKTVIGVGAVAGVAVALVISQHHAATSNPSMDRLLSSSRSIVFRTSRDAANVIDTNGVIVHVSNPSDFESLTNSVWSKIDMEKWNAHRLYKLKLNP